MGMREEAEKILKKAYAVASYNPESTCTHEELIDYVIDNTHLTYNIPLLRSFLNRHIFHDYLSPEFTYV